MSPTTPSASQRPVVTGVVFNNRPQNGDTYLAGEEISVGIRFSQQVSITGRPQLALTIGVRTRQATTYQDSALMDFRSFRYTVQRDDLDENGIGIAANALALNGETIRSADGEDAILDLGTHAIGNDPDRKVDGSGGTAPPEPEPDCTMQIQGDGYTVCYDQGYRADAEFVRDVLNPASGRFRARYGPSTTPVEFKLYAQPGELARPGRATAVGGRSGLTIHIMARSAPAMQGACCTVLGFPYQSDEYQIKLLTHEYSTAFQHNFPGFYSKPSWFHQGLQEYEGFFAVGSPDVWRLAAEKTYNDNSISCGQGLMGEGLTITDHYTAGATYFRYLADRFGEQIHIDMIRDGRANASQILADLTGETPCETFDHFRNWMYEEYGLGEPVP